MDYCDRNQKVVEWGSEEIAIPYVSPLDQKIHRYFPDFYMKVRQRSGAVKKFIIERKKILIKNLHQKNFDLTIFLIQSSLQYVIYLLLHSLLP